MRVNEALKKDNESTIVDKADEEADPLDCRLNKPKVSVMLVTPDSMRRKVADLIRHQLSKSKTEDFLRKPIVICVRSATKAKDLTDYLKHELRDCKKILCLADYNQLEDSLDQHLLGK